MTSLIDRSPETLKENHFRSHANLNFVQTKETQGNLRVYAIAFDMDIESLRQSYGDLTTTHIQTSEKYCNPTGLVLNKAAFILGIAPLML
jgi:hypothetical protein